LAKSLVIIGGGTEQVPAYERAKRRGLTVIGTDADRNAPALALADHIVIASTRDPKQTVDELRRFSTAHAFDGVMTIANDVPLTVARVAQVFGLPGISVESAQIAQDKLEMKYCFERDGVACPGFIPVGSVEELRRIIHQSPNEKFVLKPVDGRGARGVLLLDSSSDFEWAFAESSNWGESGRFIVETFIPGIQLSTESFLLGEKIYTAAYALRNYDRLEQFAPYIIEDGGDIPAPIDGELERRIDELILRGARAMGIHEGIVKGDIVINSEGEPMIIELAARLSGGWFATDQIPRATGIDLVEAVISHALGEAIETTSLTRTKHRATAIRYWFPKAGTIRSVNGAAQLKALPSVIKHAFFRGTGDTQPQIRMHPDRFGFVIVEGNNRQEALGRVNEALATVTIETQVESTG